MSKSVSDDAYRLEQEYKEAIAELKIAELQVEIEKDKIKSIAALLSVVRNKAEIEKIKEK